MNEAERLTIECPYRGKPTDNSDREIAVCGLLQQLTGVRHVDLCQVRSDACHSCCQWFRPSADHVNPVVASLLYNLSAQILHRGGVPGCSLDEAARLNQFASENIPPEEDCVSVAEETNGQTNLDCVDVRLIVPCPKHRSGRRVTRWAVGVTTAPRDTSTLDVCLASLAAGGWQAPRLFVDGRVTVPAGYSELPVTHRDPQIGAWPSYYLALVELAMRSPEADAYLLVQDDVVLFRHPSLRCYLEKVLWPGRRPGLVSLFCSRAYTQQKRGWHLLEGALVWGGQAIIFSREAVTAFLSDAQVVHHRWSPGTEGLANIDRLIGEWALRTGIPVYLPTPSLAQHVGHVSSLWPKVRAYGNRRADRFAGEMMDQDVRE